MGCFCSSHSKKTKKSEVASVVIEQLPTEPAKPPDATCGMIYHIIHSNTSTLVEFDIDRHRTELVDMTFRSYSEAGICLLDEDTLILAGGLDKVTQQEVKNVLLLNTKQRTIREASLLPHARKYLRLVCLASFVFAVGGVRTVHRRQGSQKITYSEYSANFARWTKGVDKWTELDDMPIGLENPSVVIHQDLIYVMGGCRFEGKSLLVSDLILTFGSTWTVTATKLPVPLYCCQAVQVSSEGLMIFGGLQGNEEVSRQTYLYKGGHISEGPKLPNSCTPVFSSYSKVCKEEVFVISEEGSLFTFNVAASSWIAHSIVI